MRCLLLCTVAVLLVVADGCAPPRYRLHGIVRYKGEPLTAGTIIFLGPDNQVYPAKIQTDGSYQIAAVPRGHILVGIQPEVSRGQSRPQPGAEGITKTDDGAHQRATKTPGATTAPTIPSSYADPNHSGLSFELESPGQEYSPNLE